MRELPLPLTAARLEEMLADPAWERGDCWITTFGKSILGRPLRCLAVGQGRPCILCVAGHHAMEWLCGWVLLSFARALLGAEAQHKAPRGSFIVVPLLNPDGVELQSGGYDTGSILAPRQLRFNSGSTDFTHWQANGRGVDLNHNYPAGFDAYRTVEAALGIYEGAPTRFSGVAPLSEPETRALSSLIDTLSPDLVLSLHTQGEEVFCGASPDRRTRLLAELTARRLGYTLSSPTGAAAYGGLTDWLTERGIPAMTLECGKGCNPLPPTDFPPMERRLLPLLFALPRLLEFVNNL